LPANATAAIRQRFLAMQALRKTFFSESENSAMFGFDDAYDMDAINRLEISQNRQLTALQKREKIDTLDAAMSPALRAAKEAPYQVIKLDQLAKELRDRGASEDDVYRMRAAATTPEAAARLAQVDYEESQWKQRIATYLTEKNTVMNMKTGAMNQELAMQLIRDQRFTQEEKKRLPAYE
jgi:lipase chaperone LimK